MTEREQAERDGRYLWDDDGSDRYPARDLPLKSLMIIVALITSWAFAVVIALSVGWRP